MNDNFKIAAVQLEYEFLDLEKSCLKAVDIIKEAGANGADLIGFPELYLPGFPFYILMGPVGYTIPFFPKFYDNSIEIGDKYTQMLQLAAKKANINVVMGYSQRIGHSLYISQMTIDRSGNIVANRSKLKPTHVERTIFGQGNGSDIVTVDLPGIGKTGALCCWEHLLPLLRASMQNKGEIVHVASWPAFCTHEESAYSLGPTVCVGQSRSYSVESQCFTIVSTGILKESDLEIMQLPPEQPFLSAGGGYATIFGPDGKQLTEKLDPKTEGILYVDANIDYLKIAKHFIDPVGHYSRPDIFKLLINDTDTTLFDKMEVNYK